MYCEVTKMINRNPFGHLILKPCHLVESFDIVVIRKDVAAVVNVENRVYRALPYVVVVIVDMYWRSYIGNSKDVLVL